MNYLIDGYNVIGVSRQMSLADKDKEEQFVALLSAFFSSNKDTCTVVFDGKSLETGWQSNYYQVGIDVVFTDSAESADDYIVRYVKKCINKSSLKIVTSDKQICLDVKPYKVKTLSSTDFLVKLYQAKQLCAEDDSGQVSGHTDVDYWLEKFT